MTTATKKQPSSTKLPLEGKVTLVTGGTRGIGPAISHRLAADGARVGAGYWRHHRPGREVRGQRESEDIPARSPSAAATCGDAPTSCRRGARGHRQHGRLDILVNNAGITIDKTVAKMGDEDWSR